MTNLLSPGPVPVLEEISLAQTKEMITHRSEAMTELYRDLVTRLKKYLNSDESYILTGSGALGLETLVMNLCDRNDRVVCFPNGDFGNKQVLTVKVYSNAIENTIEDGKGWNLERTKEKIDSSDATVLAIVYNETSLGVRNNIREICRYSKSKGMLTIVDGISAWPGTEMDMKEFGVDGFVAGSQKCPGAPPGMALLGLSKDAVDRYSSRELIPGYYCDLRRHKKYYEKNMQTPNTPAITLFWALQKAFDILDEKGGVEAAVKRHASAAEYTRNRLLDMDIALIAEKGFESNTVTGFVVPEGFKAADVKKRLKAEFDIQIVGARGTFKENGLRIAHMGNFDISNIEAALDAMEKIIK
ncbi:alanine--glyoxylate aminotransferase family protein [Candidatus Micrarchaeota archaeon]|nr:alanine--glyoxylate aminotransferase family protein [Candidatus Micrarchaeota archaeon]